MISLTKHQEAVCVRLATGDVSRYAAVTSVESDGSSAQKIDEMFAEDMQLVEQGLLYDITSQPKWKERADAVLKDEGRTLRVLSASIMVKMMFGRVPWSGIN
jgi:hypothetical protein